MLVDGKFSPEDREGWINFCVEVAEDIGENIPREYFEALDDIQLDLESDWFYELSGK